MVRLTGKCCSHVQIDPTSTDLLGTWPLSDRQAQTCLPIQISLFCLGSQVCVLRIKGPRWTIVCTGSFSAFPAVGWRVIGAENMKALVHCVQKSLN